MFKNYYERRERSGLLVLLRHRRFFLSFKIKGLRQPNSGKREARYGGAKGLKKRSVV